MLLYFLDRIFFFYKTSTAVCIVHWCLCSYPNQYDSLTFVSNPLQLSFTLQAYYYLLYRHSDVKVTKEDKILQTKA